MRHPALRSLRIGNPDSTGADETGDDQPHNPLKPGRGANSAWRDYQQLPDTLPVPSSLAQLVIPVVIPPGPTAANQTALNGMPSQPQLPRPYWSGLSGIWAVIS
jgi:hypothetical protein